MRNFYSYLTEVEGSFIVDADASLYDYQRQISQMANMVVKDIAKRVKSSHDIQRDYDNVLNVSIRKGTDVIKIPVSIKYDEVYDKKGWYVREPKMIVVNSLYYDEDNWLMTNILATVSHEINHAVDHINDQLNSKVLTRSKFVGCNNPEYWCSENEFRSICMAMQTHMESKMRGFVLKDNEVNNIMSPETLVSMLENYVKVAKENKIRERKKKFTREEAAELSKSKLIERGYILQLFGKSNYDIVYIWRKTPMYWKFIEYMEELAAKWRNDYI